MMCEANSCRRVRDLIVDKYPESGNNKVYVIQFPFALARDLWQRQFPRTQSIKKHLIASIS
jgi:hypothetical protein